VYYKYIFIALREQFEYINGVVSSRKWEDKQDYGHKHSTTQKIK